MKTIELTADEINRVADCYMISKGKDDTGCGVKFQIVPLSGSRTAFNIEANFRISMIRFDEFCLVTGLKYPSVSNWAYKDLIKTRMIGTRRWIDIDSVTEFLKTYGVITIKQREAFDERLMEVYEIVLYLMRTSACMENIVLTVL